MATTPLPERLAIRDDLALRRLQLTDRDVLAAAGDPATRRSAKAEADGRNPMVGRHDGMLKREDVRDGFERVELALGIDAVVLEAANADLFSWPATLKLGSRTSKIYFSPPKKVFSSIIRLPVSLSKANWNLILFCGVLSRVLLQKIIPISSKVLC